MTTAYVGPNGQWVSRADTPNPANAASYTNLTASGAVVARPGTAIGYVVTTALSAAAITVYDNASAASGTVLFVIPASTAAGAPVVFGDGIIAANGIYASFGGTGTVNFLYK